MTIKNFLKAFYVIGISIVLIVVCAGCKVTDESFSASSINIENDSNNVINDNVVNHVAAAKKLNIDELFYLGISGDYFYYMSEINSTEVSADYSVIKYNLKTDESKKLGEVKGIHSCSNVIAFVGDDKLYVTFGVAGEENIINEHMEIDLKSGGVTVLSKDNGYPPLVENISVNEMCFVEYQPNTLEDGSYRNIVRVVDAKSGEANDIIVKNRKIDHSGELLRSVSVYADVIYTFEYAAKTPYVCSYDLSGNLLTKENVELVNDFLNTPDEITGDTETMWSIDVINGYYFFQSLNGKRLVLQKNGSQWIKREDLIMNRGGFTSNLIVDYNPHGSDYTKVVLYDYNTKELSYLDTVTGEKILLNIELPGATYCMTDGKQLIFMNEKQELYYIEDVYAK